MVIVENVSKEELHRICHVIGESFVTNDLFYEFGSIEDRKDFVLQYMDAYVRCVYEMKALYRSEDGKAYIGLAYSDQKKIIPQIKMLLQMLHRIPFAINKRFLKHVKEISDGNKRYTQNTYLEILMVCVEKEYQGQKRAKELVDFAKEKASERAVPLLFDTDMEAYARMYEHYGCTLYNKKTASNGITRYNLVWNESR